MSVMTELHGRGVTAKCAVCHGPVSLLSGHKDPTLGREAPDYMEGDSCVVCHAVRKVDEREIGSCELGVPRTYLFDGRSGRAARTSPQGRVVRAVPQGIRRHRGAAGAGAAGRASRRGPTDMAPSIAERIELQEEVVLKVEIDEAVRVVGPTCREGPRPRGG